MRPLLQAIFARPDFVDSLRALVTALRPRGDGRSRVAAMNSALEADDALRERLRTHLRAAFHERRCLHLLAEGGILADEDLRAMIARGIGAWFLPPVPPADDVRELIGRIFERNDWKWVARVPMAEWARLAKLCLEVVPLNRPIHADVGLSLRTLALRVAGAGIHEELERKRAFTDDDGADFIALPHDVDAFLAVEEAAEDDAGEALTQVRTRLRSCRKLVRQLRTEKHRHGTSLRLTRLTRRMDQQMRRMEALLCLAKPRDERQRSTVVATLGVRLLEAEQDGYRVRRRIGQGIDELAYQITEHTATKGEKYTDEAKSSYGGMLAAAMGGGAIVGVFALLKLYASSLSLSLAGQVFVYGLNYALCFVLIYVTGASLATKQPAITAAAIAKQLDECESRREGLEQVADSVVRVWRNQFVAFLGNLLCAFPVAFGVGSLVERLGGAAFVDDDKAWYLLEANHPFDGPALFYAAVAGVFLFVAGLVQGVVDNRVVYTRFEYRLAHHPRLAWLGKRRASLAAKVGKHAGGITSNVILGFLLGSAGVVGVFFGLPIDIRHIAFSSAHVGVAVLDAPHLIDAREVGILCLGVLGIGFVNFIVSFGLTLGVTLKSRQVTLTQGGALIAILLRHFIRSPLSWILPVPVKINPKTDVDTSE
ncbi:MAG: hypothetical protein AB8H86_20565 [Polyangiales bacterium]